MDNEIFKNKKVNIEKLISFGFVKNKNIFEYSTDIMNGDFTLRIEILKSGKMRTKLTDNVSGELYTLHLIEGASGSFVGQVKEEYETVLNKIKKECFETEVFINDCTKKIMKYIETTYKDSPEYLWEKFPRNAIYRRKDNKKWYAAILTTKRSSLGLNGEEIEEIIDLRAPKEDIGSLIDNKTVYAGYHMNKKHWITIILDGSVSEDVIVKYIDTSYKLALKK